MGYRLLGDKLYTCYLILQQIENYTKENYSEDNHLCNDCYNLREHCGSVMRSIGYSEPKVDK